MLSPSGNCMYRDDSVTVLKYYRLRTQFQENSEESVQLSVVHSLMTDRFPGLKSALVWRISCLGRDIFPNVSVKRLGKKRVSCIVGIELRQPLSPLT